MSKRNPNHGLGRLTQEDLCRAAHPPNGLAHEIIITRHTNTKVIGMRGLIVGTDSLDRQMWFNPMKCCDESLNDDQYVTLEGE
jgi:hypothetical protein